MIFDASLSVAGTTFYSNRPLRLTRIFFVLENSRQSRSNCVYYIKLIPTMIKIFSFIFLYILTFGMIGTFVFTDQLKEPNFVSLEESCLTLFLTMTTVVYPDVSLPAWSQNKFYSLYFVTFLIISIFIMSNIFFVEIFSTYREYSIEDFQKKTEVRRHSLNVTFKILTNGEQNLSKDVFVKFVKAIYPRCRDIIIDQVFSAMADKELLNVQIESFQNVLDLLQIHLSNRDRHLSSYISYEIVSRIQNNPFLHMLLGFFFTQAQWIQKLALYRWIQLALLVGNALHLFIGIEWKLISTPIWINFNLIMFSFFCLEIVLDFSSLNFRWDVSKVGFLRFSLQFFYVMLAMFSGITSPYTLGIQSILSFRILAASSKFMHTVDLFLASLKYLLVNLVFVLLVMYVYVILGIIIFSDVLIPVNFVIMFVSPR